jgi:DNA-binding response OmpR family regulator
MSVTVSRILVADDESEIRDLLAKYLEREGFAVDAVAGGRQALACVAARRYDLVILDLMMPDIDGFEVCRQIRNAGSIPVIILSAKGQESDKVSGLMIGADDYMTKPFSMNELLARVRAHLRRSALGRAERSPDGNASVGIVAPDEGRAEPVEGRCGVSVDLDRHAVRKNGVEVALTPKEFDLLVFLMRHPGQVFTKSRIFRAVWGEQVVEDDNTVMVHVRRLRSKIEDDPSEPRLVKTVHGIGYSFTDEAR